LGKTDNSQAAVFGALCAYDRVIPVDVELFLPEKWTSDKERCKRAGVPEERYEHKTKPELAIEIVRRQRALGVRFDYVCADGLYGNNSVFCRTLDNDGETFVLHVHADQFIYLEDPKPKIPENKSIRGRKPTKLKAQVDPIRVDALYKKLTEKDFERIIVRKTTTGELEIDAYRRAVWVWDGEEASAKKWTLFIRRDVKSPAEIKYCLTNATFDTPTIAIARMEAQRFWIERSFEDAKGQVGMAEYQVRGWLAWYHHMSLVMMTMLFMTKQRMLFNAEYALLSCHDIKILLAYFLPKKNYSVDEILRQMKIRHAKREAASKSASNRREKGLKEVPQTGSSMGTNIAAALISLCGAGINFLANFF
jgi:SRSO17 transposase